MTIEAAHYEETRKRLMEDPIVVEMAAELPAEFLESMLHESGTPRHQFMGMANETYRKRGGTDGGHIGAIAEAITRLVEEREA